MIGKANLELMGIPELREILLDNDRLNLLKNLGIPKSEIEEVIKEKRVFHLAETLFGETSFLTPSIEVSALEYDVVGDPRTQNAAASDVKMTIASVARKILERFLEAIDNKELLEEDF